MRRANDAVTMRDDVSIRPYRREDAQPLYEAARESVSEVSTWLPWCHVDYSLADAEQWTSLQERHFAEDREYAFVVVDSGGRFLGGCGLNQINRIHRFANVGYWVRSSETGRGVAPAAIRRLAAFAFAKTDLVRLEILCVVANARSQRAAEKAGAIREGLLHDRLLLRGQAYDAVMYALTRSTWRP